MKLTDSEFKMMKIIWKKEPISSGELVKICNEKFGWKKSTTYTFIKRLQERKAVVNNESFVSSLVRRKAIQREECAEFIDTVFDGDIIKLLEIYLEDNSLTTNDIQNLKELLKDQLFEEKKFIRFEV